MAIPLLPADDPRGSARQTQVDKAREDYNYDFSNGGILFAEEVPKSDALDFRYIAKVGEIELQLTANRVASKLALEKESLELNRAEKSESTGITTNTGRARSLKSYDHAICALPTPHASGVWNDDAIFGWQRVAGENAHMIWGVSSIPNHFPVTEDHFLQAMGGRAEDDSLEAALADGRVFLADYARLDGMRNNTAGGVQHFSYAPMGLFCVEKTHGRRLMPVAIQTGQTPSAANPVFTPVDGRKWTLAKQCYQSADMIIHGQVYHFGYCHVLLEAMILSSKRTLAANHPILVLLEPHYQYTLGANDAAKSQLVAPGGYIDRLLGASLEDTNQLMLEATRSLSWKDLVPASEFEAQGTGDTDRLPIYPWRDDGLLSWPVLKDFVGGYLRLYYTSDAAVAQDTELARWLTEIGSADGAKLPKFCKSSEIQTVDALITLITGIIYRGTVYHAGINYAAFDWQSLAPCKTGSGYAMAPGPQTVDHDDSLRAMMPSLDLVDMASILLMQQREIRLTRLLYYGKHFIDPRVAPILKTAQNGLTAIDETIAARNLRRPLDYSYVAPRNVPQSIMV